MNLLNCAIERSRLWHFKKGISHFFKGLFLFITFLLTTQNVRAQCPATNPFQLEHPGSGATGITPATLNTPVFAHGTWAGHFVRVNVEAGKKYNFSLVGSEDTLRQHFAFPGGIVPNITFLRPEVDHDPIITIYDNTGSTAGFQLSGNVLAFNEDASATETMSELDFTAPYTGELRVAVDLQPGTVAYNPGTGPPNVIHASAPADCGQLFQDSTTLRVTWIPSGPALFSATKDSDTQITATFTQNVQTKGTNPTDFAVTDGLGASFAVSTQADGTAGDANIVLTVADLSTAVGDLKVAYTNNNNEIADATDITAVAASGITVIDLDNTAPTLVSATRDSDTQITLTFSESVKTNGGNSTDFTVKDAANTAFNVTAQADGTAQDNQIVLTTDDLSTAQLSLTVTYTNNNNEVADFGSNSLATDATGVKLSIFSLSNVTGPFYWEYQGGGPSLPAGPNPAGLDVAVLPLTPQRQGSVAFGDLDGDGDVDFISGGNRGTLFYFQNTGTPTSPQWEHKTGVINSLDTIKIGKVQNTNEVSPTLHDFDQDGDLDLIVGSRWNYSGLNKWEDVYVFINGGTATNPVFDPVILDNRYGIGINADRPFFRELPIPAFVDIDGDNDSDMLIAGSDSISYFKNIGTATAPFYEWQQDDNNPLRPVSRGGTANEPDFLFPTLQFADFDNDGDFDMYFPSEDGFVEVMENTGTATSPVFTNSAKLGEPFNSTDHGAFGKLGFADVNNDGIVDIMTTNWNPTEWFWYAGRTTVVNPILTSVTKNSDTQITATFDQNVQTNGGNPTDFTVIDGQGTNYAVSAQSDGTAGDKDIVLTVVNLANAVGDLTVTYTNNNNEISDAASGANPASNGSKKIDLDTTVPTLVSATKDSDTQITVTLSEAIQTNGTNPMDFTVTDGVGTNFTVSAQADGTANDTKIVLTVADLSGATGDMKVTYTNNNNEISDFGSNNLATDATGVSINSDTSAPILSSATKDSNTQITLTFNEPVKTNGTNPTDFSVTDGVGDNFAVSTQADGTAKDTKIVLTVADLSTAVGDLKVTYANNNNEISDFGGNNLAADATGVSIDADATAPTATSFAKDSDTQITITFSEPMSGDLTNLSSPIFFVTDGFGTSYAISNVSDGTAKDNKMVLTVADLSSAVGDLKLVVDSNAQNEGGTLKDFGGNDLLNNTGGLSLDLDTTPPTMVSGRRTSNTELAITFSEAVQVVSTAEDFIVKDANNTRYNVTGITDGTAKDKEVTLTVDDISTAVGPLKVTFGFVCQRPIADFGNNLIQDDLTGITISLNATVTSVMVPSNSTYAIGNELNFTVNYDKAITITGSPTFPITIGSATVNATLNGSVNNATTANFKYVVREGEEDTDGIAVGSAITLNGGTIKDGDNLDADLNLNSIGVTTAVLVDGIKPTTTINSISDDTGKSNSDQITNDQSLFVNGTTEPNSRITLKVDGQNFGGEPTADGSGNWQFSPIGEGELTVSEGVHIYTAFATDAAGNVGEISANFTVTVDLTAPAAPVITGISDDTGISSTDEVTNDQTLTFVGTAEANSTVEVFIGGTSIGTTSADGSGNFSYNHSATTLSEGNLSVTAKATDAAGNTSVESAALNVVIDVTAPGAPVVSGITTDSGSNTSDEITNDQTLSFNGTAEANSTVEVFIAGSSIGTTTADGWGNWTYDHTGTSLTEATHSITAKAIDAAGNTSAASTSLSVTIDVTAPGTPVVSGITTDSGSNTSDEITNDQTLSFNGTAEANSTVEVFVAGSSIGTTTVDGSGNWTYDHTGTSLTEATHSVTAKATDVAGNTSAESLALNVVVDITAPSAPVVTGITTDSGTSTTDAITNDNTLKFNGTAEAGTIVELFIGGISVGATTTDNFGKWSYDHTGVQLSEGIISITAKATDVAGNVGVVGNAFNVTVDTVAPLIPFIDAITDDTGSASTDFVTSDNKLLITGTAEANSTVEFFIDANSVGSTSADGSGKFSFDYTGTILSDGSYTLTAKATDVAGNTSDSSTASNLAIDTTAPAAPLVLTISEDSGSSGVDEITNDNTLIFAGTAEANSTVEVFIGELSVGTANVDNSGDWSLDHTGTALADGSFNITAKATDVAGNTSVESLALNVVVDTSAPAAPTVDLSASSDLGVSSTDDLTSDATPTIEGTAEANASIDVFVDGTKVGSTSADGSGNWTLTPITDIADGSKSITAQATDAAGNKGVSSTALVVTIDTHIATPTFSPADNSIDILPSTNLSLTFAENVNKGTGNVIIKQKADDSILETIAISGSNVSIANKVVTIDPVNLILPPDTEFYINIEAGALTDDAGNNYSISNTTDWSFRIIVASVVTGVAVPTNGTYNIGDNLDFMVNMTLPVTISGKATIPVTIGSTTINASQVGTVSNSGNILFRYTVVENDLDVDGIVAGSAINLNGGTMKDQFGTDALLTLNNVANTSSVLVDGVKPTPTISSSAVDLVNGSFSTTITYDEAVENFSLTDLTVSNGTANNLSNTVSGTTWSVDITPIADGEVSVSLGANVANDIAGNDNKASNTISRTFDGTAPEVVSVNRKDSDPLNTATTEANFRITFSESVTGVDLTDLEVVLTATATGTLNSITPVDAKTYDVNVNGIGGEGTIGLNVKNDDSIIDAATNPLAATFTGQVYTTNYAPTDIGLSTSNIDENNALSAVVASLSTTDADAGDSHTYTLIAGAGDTDNATFVISGAELKTNNISFNFESNTSYSIRLKTDDGKGGTFEKVLTITINDVNEVPVSLNLSNNTIDEADDAQSVGTFATLDADAGDTFTYSLVTGTGDNDNAEFTIIGNALRTAGLINFEDGPTRSILVRVTDSGGLTLDQQFTINIEEVVIEPIREFDTNTPTAAVRNVFSPNGDGINETWVIEDIKDNPINTVKVYAQGGKLIYSQDNYQNDWDGTFKGNPIPPGTYYYEINIYNGEKIIKGFLTIIRSR